MNAGLRGSSVLALVATGCVLYDPEPPEEPANLPPPMTLSSSVVFSRVEAAPPMAPDAEQSNEEELGATDERSQQVKTSGCPERMVEVAGDYCPDLMHRCVKGGKNHLGEATEEPEPFYCDRYQVGFSKCFGKPEPKHFCIDELEFPNQQGIVPSVMVTWYEAQKLCEAQGKRLCGDDEWTLACEGRERRPFPYGWERDASACNIDHPWIKPDDGILGSRTAEPSVIQAEVVRLSRRVPSGSMPLCVSQYGVMDMVGNVDEWAVNVTLHGKPYQSTFKGGHWMRGARNRCRPVTVSHDENTYYYAEGFRCCADWL